MPEDQRIPRFLKRRRILRHTAVFFLILILLSIVLDHAGEALTFRVKEEAVAVA